MNNALDEHAQLDVEISNLRATDEELENLKALIVKCLGNNATSLKVTAISNDTKVIRYELTFRVLNPRHFKLPTVQDWLYAAGLFGWNLNATFVRP